MQHDYDYYDSLGVTYQVTSPQNETIVNLNRIDRWLIELQTQVAQYESRNRKRFNQNDFARAVEQTIKTAYSA